MRKLVTGVDDAGRSGCVEEREMSFDTTAVHPRATGAGIFETDRCPPPARPAGQGQDLDVRLGPGLVRWSVVRLEPEFPFWMHHTDTIDLDVVLDGSVEIVLDDGAHLLEAGDCVVVTGVDHAWRVGPRGVTMSVTTIGTPPRT
jgi:mannose-6-phosphate isomerase-like protein (cupin superfamily)